MIISLLVAMDENRGIGKSNHLPWRLSSDLKRFRELTMGHHIIVGRKTFESIGKPLPGRQTIIVTRNERYRPEGCLIAHSVEGGIRLAQERGESELFVCGGAEVYAQSLGLADRMYLTLVHATVDADTFFPEWESGDWTEEVISRHDADEKNQFPFTFKLLNKKYQASGSAEAKELETGSGS
jgi:dihydrofolate reductase